MRKRLLLSVLAALVVGVLSLSACAEKLDPPAAAIQSLLELRLENSTDVAQYARYFEESSLATALADDAAARKGKKGAVPEWRTPELKSSTETSAVVVITWKPSDAFKGWPKQTTFVLKKVGGRWVVVDAAESGSEETTKTP